MPEKDPKSTIAELEWKCLLWVMKNIENKPESYFCDNKSLVPKKASKNPKSTELNE